MTFFWCIQKVFPQKKLSVSSVKKLCVLCGKLGIFHKAVSQKTPNLTEKPENHHISKGE